MPEIGVGTDPPCQYDGLDPVSETGPGGAVANLLSLAIDEALTRPDAAGSLVHLTDPTDATPTTYTYAPFDDTAVSGATPNAFQFTGRENDGTGLYHYRAQ